jgi:hypothetical protein
MASLALLVGIVGKDEMIEAVVIFGDVLYRVLASCSSNGSVSNDFGDKFGRWICYFKRGFNDGCFRLQHPCESKFL